MPRRIRFDGGSAQARRNYAPGPIAANAAKLPEPVEIRSDALSALLCKRRHQTLRLIPTEFVELSKY
jgi:hypothetical protein